MSVTKITYAADEAIAVTAWGTGLAATQWATSAIFDNTTNLYMDVMLGGILELDATTPVAGDTMDIYLAVNYQTATATDMTGGIDALFDAATEEVVDTAFVQNNLIFLTSVSVEATTPAIAQGYHWSHSSVAEAAGGNMPQKFMLVLHNNTAGTMAAGSNVNAVGVTYTTV